MPKATVTTSHLHRRKPWAAGACEGRYAAIDIGTVTCRMLVADVAMQPDGRLGIVPVAKEYAVTNLGEGVDVTRLLLPEAIGRVDAVIGGYLEELRACDTKEHPLVDVMTVATSASRDADNADELVTMLGRHGLSLAVIPGETEAALSFMGASAGFSGEQVMVVDVGGGSTEVSLGKAAVSVDRSQSFDVGCRRVTERFWDGYPPSPDAVWRARAWIRPVLDEWFSAGAPATMAPAAERMVAVAGSATSVVAMRDEIEPYDPSRVNGATVTARDLAEQIQRLSSLSLDGLEHVRGLDPRRAPVIVAGMVILDEVMHAAGVGRFTASESDILEGMIMYTVQHAKDDTR